MILGEDTLLDQHTGQASDFCALYIIGFIAGDVKLKPATSYSTFAQPAKSYPGAKAVVNSHLK